MARTASTTPSENGILWLVLDEASQAALHEHVPPVFENVFCHHVTLWHDISPDDEQVAALANTTQTISAYAIADNGKAQAVRVKTPGLPDKYGVPHITISTAKGVTPFQSVAMLQGDHTEVPLDPPLTLTGTIQFEPLRNLTN
jgi:hypothetical protein